MESPTQASVVEEDVQLSFSPLGDLSLEGRDAFWPRHIKCQRLDAFLLKQSQRFRRSSCGKDSKPSRRELESESMTGSSI